MVWDGLVLGTPVFVHEREEFIVLQKEVEISFYFRILGAGKSQASIFSTFKIYLMVYLVA